MSRNPSSRSALFRSAALAGLERATEPVQPTPLVSSLHWIALLAIAILIMTGLGWLFFGTVELGADGRGLVVRDSEFGIFEVAGGGGGRIAEVLVKEGDSVAAGQVIATLHLPELREQIEASEKLLKEPGGANDDAMRQRAVEIGLHLEELKIRYENERTVRSSRAGRVIEVVVGEGNVIPPGRTILRLESLTGNYEVLAYISALEGKKIQPGMTVRVVPSTVRAHESGHLLGRVNYVSTYPVTRDYLISELGGNARLAEYLLEQGSSIEVDIDLLMDPVTGRHLWSRTHPDAVAVESGLLVDAFVVIEEVRPISLFLPSWK